jgi:hypothetical protein
VVLGQDRQQLGDLEAVFDRAIVLVEDPADGVGDALVCASDALERRNFTR